MKRLLYYYPSNKKSVVIETILRGYVENNHDVYFLTTCERGVLHENLEKFGVKTFAHPISKKNAIWYYLSQLFFLISFCRKNKIDVVLSNLQHVNFIAVFAQYFIKAKVFIFRHHFKFVQGFKGTVELNKTEAFFDKVINLLAKEIIVPSSGVYNGMKEYEKVNMNKVKILPYFYDFSLYGKPNVENVEKIKQRYPAHLRLIMCARLIPLKRHIEVFPMIKKLKEEGLDIKMFVLDEGPEKENLEKYIKDNHLEETIIMLGFRRDFLDYMAASDVLIHPSLTEASNSVVKEMGLMEKAVIVCEKVGDFDDYIVHNENGILIPRDFTQEQLLQIIRDFYQNKEKIALLGKNLRSTVMTKFGYTSENLKVYNLLLS